MTVVAPWMHAFQEFAARFRGDSHPSIDELNSLLPAGVMSGGGAPLRFRAAGELPWVDYEQHIYETGEVSTREASWHDTFNALAWCRWPRLKGAMNALHYQHLEDAEGGRRGPVRDALTLLDESGALVVSRDRALLGALAERDWERAFVGLRDAWAGSRCLLCGHALLEKLRAPYKAVTAHVLLLQLDASATETENPAFPAWLDERLGEALRAGGLCDSPAALSPLPLAGIPGWWPAGESREVQDAGFYADRAVFRPARPGQAPAPVFRASAGLGAIAIG